MKKIVRCLAVLLVLSLAGTAVPVRAMLTKEEQEYYKKKKESAKPQSQTPVTEADREMVTSSGVHVEIENLDPGRTQNSSAVSQETETETESQMQTETATAQTESETQTETETAETESGTQTETETEETETDGTWEGEAPLVAIDPGHQSLVADLSAMEPNGPDSDEMKPCYTEGTKGVQTGIAEYELNLAVALKLKSELEKRGYRVLLTRETNDVEISESQRSLKANEAGADIYIRLHANSDEDSERKGALTGAPSSGNPYLKDIYNSCIKLADDILNEYCETTGLDNRGLWITDSLTGSNWSEMPVTLLEMGYMTNPDEDTYMADEANQNAMAEGIANGVDKYFGR